MVLCKCWEVVPLSRSQLQLLVITKAPATPASLTPKVTAARCLVLEGSMHHACLEALKP